MNIQNLKVGTRLSLGFSCVCLLLVIIVGIGINKLSSLNDGTSYIIEQKWPKIERATDALRQTDVIAIALRNMMLNEDPRDRQKQSDLIVGARQKAEADLNDLKATMATSDGKEKLDLALEKRGKYIEGQNKLSALILDGKVEESKSYLNNELRPVLAAYKGALDELIKFEINEINATGKAASQTYTEARNFMAILGALALALAVAIGLLITRSLLKQLGGEPRYAADIASHIASGDLAVAINVKPEDQSSLLYAMESMRNQLAQMVAKVRTGTDAIATASSQIASGNLDLSARTEEQAASLEETASSMEELTSTVRQNADNAHQASSLATNASEVAVKGGAVVAQVIDTMGAINDASKKIADIITVIDGIAFQTNILALNAAVEAARAGEQGRGFAVVATEVRSLAQRSAGAAKEIKALIGDSVEKVDSGSKLVDEAGKTMEEIVMSVRQVTDIISEIAAASVEQRGGIEQVNQAISQMDQVTQQNAALVEEASAAAQAMQQQAGDLASLVSVFKVQNSHSEPHAGLPNLNRDKKPNLERVRTAAPRHASANPKVGKAPSALALRHETGNTADDWEEF